MEGSTQHFLSDYPSLSGSIESVSNNWLVVACSSQPVQVRPRIKGRFATREEVLAMKAEKQQQQGQMFDDCVVPNFA